MVSSWNMSFCHLPCLVLGPCLLVLREHDGKKPGGRLVLTVQICKYVFSKATLCGSCHCITLWQPQVFVHVVSCREKTSEACGRIFGPVSQMPGQIWSLNWEDREGWVVFCWGMCCFHQAYLIWAMSAEGCSSGTFWCCSSLASMRSHGKQRGSMHSWTSVWSEHRDLWKSIMYAELWSWFCEVSTWCLLPAVYWWPYGRLYSPGFRGHKDRMYKDTVSLPSAFMFSVREYGYFFSCLAPLCSASYVF